MVAHARLFRERTVQAVDLLRAGQIPSANALYRSAEPNIEVALNWQEAQGDPAQYLEWCSQACALQISCGGVRMAIVRLQRAVRIATTDMASRRYGAWCLNMLSRALYWSNDTRGAVLALRLCRQRTAGVHDATLQEVICNHYCTLRMAQLRFRAVSFHIDRGSRLNEDSKLPKRLVVLATHRLTLLMLRGEYRPALAEAEQALELALVTADPFFLWWVQHLLVEANVRSGLFHRAQGYADDCSALQDDDFGRVLQFAARFMQFALHFESEGYTRALETLDAAGQLCRSEALPRAIAVVLGAEFILMETGRAAEVKALLSVDDSTFPFDVEFADFYVQLHCFRFRLLAQRGRSREALASFECALFPIRRSRNPLWLSWLVEAVAIVANTGSERALARQLLQQAQKLLADAGIIPSPRQRTAWRRVDALIEQSPVTRAGRSVDITAPQSLLSVVNSLEALAKRALIAAKKPQRTKRAPSRKPLETLNVQRSAGLV